MAKQDYWIAPSILSADFARLGAEVDAVLNAYWEQGNAGIVELVGDHGESVLKRVR